MLLCGGVVNAGGEPCHPFVRLTVEYCHPPPVGGVLLHDHCASTALILVNCCVATQLVTFAGGDGHGFAWSGLELTTMVGVRSGVAVGAGVRVRAGTTVGCPLAVGATVGVFSAAAPGSAVEPAVADPWAGSWSVVVRTAAWSARRAPPTPLAPSATTRTTAIAEASSVRRRGRDFMASPQVVAMNPEEPRQFRRVLTTTSPAVASGMISACPDVPAAAGSRPRQAGGVSGECSPRAPPSRRPGPAQRSP